ncbi:hypothetical protein RhiXN_05311 [Rhizoctonia solani]|uniref:Uncharacterized protein n=1 Tax=Rhizoctonia solani TaxID=456999 RepID=A0A8H8STP2_9AGAM|nr:uncharacterized protein RhiXN_05311 [Rhizoctonia solani]QRW17309.1 hypothetical protein RhiXN_05311 [Rhizoctonia solani]
MLSEYGHRRRAINIKIGDPSMIKNTMDVLLQQDILETLPELSIQVRDESLFDPDRSDHSEYITSSSSSFKKSSTGLLVELHIQNVTLGYDKAIISLLNALSFAPKLRNLRLISIATLHNPNIGCDTSTISRVTLPKLQSLTLHDLYSNTLEPLLETIGLPTYSVTLLLSSKCFRSHRLSHRLSHGEPGNEEPWGVYSVGSPERLCRLVKSTPVETLMLDGIWWMKNNAFRSLLESTPALKTLKIDYGTITQDTCLTLAIERNEPEGAVPFPSLENIHITRCVFHAGPKVEEAFKSMARSHRLQRVVLGGTVRNVNPDGTSISKGLETFGLVGWLETRVPTIRLVDQSYRSPEFYQNVWRLW